METIAGLLTPSFLALSTGLALGLAAILFVLSRRGVDGGIGLRGTLSWAEPVEVRIVLYLLIAALWGAFSLVFRAFYEVPAEGSAGAGLFLVLVVIATLGTVSFYYAAAGSLLQAAMGSRGRPAFWFSGYLFWLDGAIMNVGDFLASWMVRPAGGTAPPEDMELPLDDDGPVQVAQQSAGPQRKRGNSVRERLDLAIQEYEESLTLVQLEKLHIMRELIKSLE
ncbi:MAG: hypothetical protein JW846_09800 [Dehalococcoidia bacterium]|nr:hypothetical protein [Dehalococcoidia bacterium]